MGVAARASAAHDAQVTRRRSLAASLALGSVALATAGEALALRQVGGWIGIGLLGLSMPVAVAAWLALGAPRTRADLERQDAMTSTSTARTPRPSGRTTSGLTSIAASEPAWAAANLESPAIAFAAASTSTAGAPL